MSTELTAQSKLRDFLPLYKLGTGSFSSVYKVKRITDSQIYALKKVKILTMNEKQKLNALNQIRILASIDCHNIVSYKEAFYDEQLGVLCIVMQFANEGDLTKKIHHHKRIMAQIPQQQIWKIAHHLLLGLNHLHERSILHRDVKSANVFISSGCYKLGDLNVSKVQSNECKFASTQTGTPNYACPQIWKDEPYDIKSDIWSLGCVIYELCTFRPPFKGKNMNQIYNNVMKGSYQPIPSEYSLELHSFISKCLKKKPSQRPNCIELLKSNELMWKKCPYNQNNFDQESSSLMNTIYMPQEAHRLNESLPKSNYDGQIKSKKKLSSSQKKKNNSLCYQNNPNQKKTQLFKQSENNNQQRKQENSHFIKEKFSFDFNFAEKNPNFSDVNKNLAIQGLKDIKFKSCSGNNLSERVLKEAAALLASIKNQNSYLTQRGAKKNKHKSLNYLEEAKRKLKSRQQSLNKSKSVRKSAEIKTKSTISSSKQKTYQQHKHKQPNTQINPQPQFKYTSSIHKKILQKIDNELAKLKRAKSNQYLDNINEYVISFQKKEASAAKNEQKQSLVQRYRT